MDVEATVLKRYLTGVFGSQLEMSKNLGLPQPVFSRAFKASQPDLNKVMEVLESQRRATWKWLILESAKERENLKNIIKYQDKSISAMQQVQDLMAKKK